MKIDKAFLRQFIKFCLVGVSNITVDWGVFFLLTHFVLFFEIQAHEVYAKAIAFVLAVTNSFIWNSLWTFKEEFRMGLAQDSKKRVYPTYFFRFFIVSLIGLIFNAGAFSIIRGVTGAFFAKKEIAQLFALAVATLAVTFWNFLANKFWTYRVRG